MILDRAAGLHSLHLGWRGHDFIAPSSTFAVFAWNWGLYPYSTCLLLFGELSLFEGALFHYWGALHRFWTFIGALGGALKFVEAHLALICVFVRWYGHHDLDLGCFESRQGTWHSLRALWSLFLIWFPLWTFRALCPLLDVSLTRIVHLRGGRSDFLLSVLFDYLKGD